MRPLAATSVCAWPVMDRVASSVAVTRSDVIGRALLAVMVIATGICPRSPTLPATDTVPPPARPVKLSMCTASPVARIRAAMSVMWMPWAKSCTSPSARRRLPCTSGAVGVPAMVAASVSVPRTRRPCAVRMGSSRASPTRPSACKDKGPVADSGTPPRRLICVVGPADRLASSRASVPASVALAVSFAAGNPAAGPLRRCSPVAASRMVPVGAAGVPASLASRPISPSAFRSGANGPASAGVMLRPVTVSASDGLMVPATSRLAAGAPFVLAVRRR